MEEFRFLLTGGISAGEVPPNPLPWLGDKLWAEMNRLSSFLGFVGFAEELHKEPVSHFLPSAPYLQLRCSLFFLLCLEDLMSVALQHLVLSQPALHSQARTVPRARAYHRSLLSKCARHCVQPVRHCMPSQARPNNTD